MYGITACFADYYFFKLVLFLQMYLNIDVSFRLKKIFGLAPFVCVKRNKEVFNTEERN